MFKSITQVVAVGFLTTLVATAILAPVLPIADPVDLDIMSRHAGISTSHLLGGDEFGRDTLSRIIFGARASLSVSLVAALLAGLVGVVLGLIGAYFRGWVEMLTMRPVQLL